MLTPESAAAIKKRLEQQMYVVGNLGHTEKELFEALATLEETEKKVVELWECEDCGFSFNAIHTDEVDGKDTGEYSCPLCAESRLEKELAEAQQTIALKQSSIETLTGQVIDETALHAKTAAKLIVAEQTIARLTAALIVERDDAITWDGIGTVRRINEALGEGAKES